MELLSFSESNDLNLKYAECAEIMSSKNKNKKRRSKIKTKTSINHQRSKSTQLPSTSRKKKKDEENISKYNQQNPYKMRNKYVQYVQKHNVKPSILQLKEFRNTSYNDYINMASYK
eukprot:318272_1